MIHFDVIKIRYFSYCLSIGMILFFIFGVMYKTKNRGSVFLYHIEFSGGYQVNCELRGSLVPISSESLKHLLEIKGYRGFSVRQFSEDNFLLRFPLPSESNGNSFSIDDFESELKNSINSSFDNIQTVIVDSSFVGPGVGNELIVKAIQSIFFALLLMFLYIWIRFPSWKFSFANIISLMHDVLVILIFLIWGNVEVSLDSLIAILFIVGYSINDTVVIFSKIREMMYQESIFVPSITIINKSIAVTLKRTLITSFFTVLVVMPLWLFGGRVLENLVAPILLGILFGTYSSIGIACSVLYDSFFIFENKSSKNDNC